MVSAMCNSAQEMISLDGYWCTGKERFVMRMERIADDRIRQVWINRAGELRELRFMFRMEATQLFLVHASGWESKYVFEGPQSFRLVRRGRGAEVHAPNILYARCDESLPEVQELRQRLPRS